MFNSPSSIRLWITAGVLVASSVLLQATSHGESVIPRQPLHDLPHTIGVWSGREFPVDEQVIKAVGVTDYINRIYETSSESVQVYVGYYASQRTGDTIHSPKNCLPGSGWEPIRSGYVTIPVTIDRHIVVNEYVIQKEQDRQVVFYWYQGRGRVIANEYAARLWMAIDAVFRNRTDSALVRLVSPMEDGEPSARARLVAFAQLLFSDVDTLIPK
jgi:EpsI family protein